MEKHSKMWWVCIGWWWYLYFAWWIYPLMRLIKWLKSRKSPNAPSNVDNDDSYWLIRETEEAIIDFLKNANSGTALQVDIKKSLSGRLTPFFDDAVHELYEKGKIKTSKDGNRVRLELVRTEMQF